MRARHRWRLACALLSLSCMAYSALARDEVTKIVSSSGISGGLIVHVGCDEGRLTEALGKVDTFCVHGLSRDAEKVRAARKRLGDSKRYGRVSVALWKNDQLPYVDNSVNVLVMEPGVPVNHDECLRVLCPGGWLITNTKGRWSAEEKPWPDNIDEWTHGLYDASNNAVSKDRRAGPPQRIQWHCGPKWTRHHESMTSFQTMVSAKGRIFYFMDEGPQVSLFLPANWKLVARDAFNGKLLWTKRLKEWVTPLFQYKSGPTQMMCRLVADGDHVYAVPGLSEGLHILDAATGKTIRVLKETKACEEVLLHEGMLYLVTSDQPNLFAGAHRFSKENAWAGQQKWLRAVDPDTGKQIWALETPVAPLSFAVTERGVIFHDGKQILCLDLKSGAERWRSPPLLLDDVIPTSNTPTLVVYKDVVLFIGGKDHGDYRGGSGNYAWKNLQTFTALSAVDGKQRWSFKVPRTGFECPKDILVVDDLVWIGAIMSKSDSGAFTGRDLHTGEVKREFKPPWEIYWFHQRCHRSKATERFIIPGRTGIEFISPTKGWTSFNHWVRGACLYGTMPANGLVYQPPHPCGCYMESLLYGFNALSADAPVRMKDRPVAEERRLEKGTAFERSLRERKDAADSWPTYRRDNERSAYSAKPVPHKLRVNWKTSLKSSITALTVADGTVFTADRDRHTVVALDAMDGRERWRFMAEGRIDSPPTIHAGRAIFGSRDGYVYCLDTQDGALCWRYLAAPMDLRILADEQLESVWPLSGSVLVRNGRIYCVAGRSMFTDGGLRYVVLDVRTGKMLAEKVLDEIDPTTGKSLQLKMKDRTLPVASPDILSAKDDRIFMKSQVLTLEGNRKEVVSNRDASDQQGEDAHLFTPAGFLDDTGFHRVYMLYGKVFTGGSTPNHHAPRFAPAGRNLVVSGDRVYGFSRIPHQHRWIRKLDFHVYAASKNKRIEPVVMKWGKRGETKAEKAKRVRNFQEAFAKSLADRSILLHNADGDEKKVEWLQKSLRSTSIKYLWSQFDPSVYVNAMVMAGPNLFLAGPPAMRNENTKKALERWQGKQGGLLQILAASDGRILGEVKLDAPSIFDGMAAAYGKLYVALSDGSVVCLGGQ